jgi:hypothetical protein
MIPIREIADGDIFIVGYPKSGNTWTQNLVAGLVCGVDPEYTADRLVQELVPDVHYKRYYRRYYTPMFFKSHHMPRPEYRRVVYLLRDGRDVMVSYFYHLSALQGRDVDFMGMVRRGEGLFPCKWHEHVEAWLANPYRAEIITIKYEDLKRNSAQELRRLCAFIGADRDAAFLERVAEQASFEKMHRKEQEGRYFKENSLWPEDKHFIRRGVVGSHADEMPADVLDAFLAESARTMSKCAYL